MPLHPDTTNYDGELLDLHARLLKRLEEAGQHGLEAGDIERLFLTIISTDLHDRYPNPPVEEVRIAVEGVVTDFSPQELVRYANQAATMDFVPV